MTITQADKINFINKLSEHTIKGWKEYQILPSLTIAQAILETGWGTNNKIPNNLFGIKADNSWKGKKELVRTHEYVNGKKVYVNAYFRVYDNIYDSLRVGIIEQNKLYEIDKEAMTYPQSATDSKPSNWSATAWE